MVYTYYSTNEEFKSCVLLDYLYIKSNLQEEIVFASHLKLQHGVRKWDTFSLGFLLASYQMGTICHSF